MEGDRRPDQDARLTIIRFELKVQAHDDCKRLLSCLAGFFADTRSRKTIPSQALLRSRKRGVCL